jgi:hypothetical protein
VLGANLFDPSGQRFHCDEPAGKFENGIGIGAGRLLLFGCQSVCVSDRHQQMLPWSETLLPFPERPAVNILHALPVAAGARLSSLASAARLHFGGEQTHMGMSGPINEITR